MAEDYTFAKHCHRYACWTASRAASAGRFKNKEIAWFIEIIGLRECLESLKSEGKISSLRYEEWFLEAVTTLKSQMKAFVSKRRRNISFGVAAKVVSIYVKTYEVIAEKGNSPISRVAYPPIDSFLLKNLIKHKKVRLKRTDWSKFKKRTYLKTICEMKKLTHGRALWKLEAFWTS